MNKLILLMLLAGCTGRESRAPDRIQTEEFRIIKLTVEPDSSDWQNRCDKKDDYYKVFTLGSRSQWNLCAKVTSLDLSKKDVSYLTTEHNLDWTSDRYNEQEWKSYKLFLVPCSKFRDTSQYIIKETTSSTSALLGLVYSNETHTTEYQIKDEDLIMPCLKGT